MVNYFTGSNACSSRHRATHASISVTWSRKRFASPFLSLLCLNRNRPTEVDYTDEERGKCVIASPDRLPGISLLSGSNRCHSFHSSDFFQQPLTKLGNLKALGMRLRIDQIETESQRQS